MNQQHRNTCRWYKPSILEEAILGDLPYVRQLSQRLPVNRGCGFPQPGNAQTFGNDKIATDWCIRTRARLCPLSPGCKRKPRPSVYTQNGWLEDLGSLMRKRSIHKPQPKHPCRAGTAQDVAQICLADAATLLGPYQYTSRQPVSVAERDFPAAQSRKSPAHNCPHW